MFGVAHSQEDPVVFTDEEIIATGEVPPFPNQSGNYEPPDLIVVAGVPQRPPPHEIDCPGEFVVYASAAAVVDNCNGLGGPNDGNSRLVQLAIARATGVAARIDCKEGCTPRIEVIWRGWSCGPFDDRLFATAAAEVKVVCGGDVAQYESYRLAEDDQAGLQPLFTDQQILAAGRKPKFQNEEGTFEDPDLIISFGKPVTPPPEKIDCPYDFVIYAAATLHPENCQGFGGPNDGNNDAVRLARQRALDVADTIDCDEGCTRQIIEIWRGWDCKPIAGLNFASAAVELKIICQAEF
ncbi:MAG: hypothetical protein ACT4P5_02795 [Armatimonadota bacterium]